MNNEILKGVNNSQGGEVLGKAPEKAMKLLGREFSKEKVMNRLGIEGDDLKQAELERIERVEETYERKREVEAIINKKESVKALEILGVDPSKEKVMSCLGVGEDVIEEAKMEVVEREEQKIARQRRNSGSNKKNIQKALDVLGHDPSKEKIMNTLGMDERDIEDVEKERVEIYEQECSKKRSNSWLNKKEAQKALKVLGLDPSKDKVMETLGIVDNELKVAEEEQMGRTEEIFNGIIQKRVIQNKKANQKALKILGHDPSETKLQNKFGENYEVLRKENSDSSFASSIFFAFAPMMAGALIFVLYQMTYFSIKCSVELRQITSNRSVSGSNSKILIAVLCCSTSCILCNPFSNREHNTTFNNLP